MLTIWDNSNIFVFSTLESLFVVVIVMLVFRKRNYESLKDINNTSTLWNTIRLILSATSYQIRPIKVMFYTVVLWFLKNFFNYRLFTNLLLILRFISFEAFPCNHLGYLKHSLLLQWILTPPFLRRKTNAQKHDV